MGLLNPLEAGDSTTPAENTTNSSMRALVDWVTCSFYLDVNATDIFILIGVSDVSKMEEKHGARYEFAGYDITYTLGDIELMHDREEMKWLLNMSGQACRQYELCSTFDFITFFAMLANVDATYTRLDIAIDDFKEIYNVGTIRNAVYKKQCVTKLSDWGSGQRGKIASGKDILTMDNFYLGNSNSRYFLNVYDKKLERIARKKDLEKDEKGEDVKTWTRTEIRFKYEYAEQFVRHILVDHNELGYHIKSFLNEKIQFLTLSAMKKDSNKGRLAKDKQNICKWWKTFLNGAGRLNLTVYRPEKTLLESKEWLFNQVSTTLAMLHLYEPEKYGDLIRQLTVQGLDKMKKKHEKKVQNQIYFDEQISNYDLGWKSAKGKLKEVPRDKKMIFDEYWKQVEEQQKSLTLEKVLDH